MLPFLICLMIFPQLLNNNLLGLHIVAVDGGRVSSVSVMCAPSAIALFSSVALLTLTGFCAQAIGPKARRARKRKTVVFSSLVLCYMLTICMSDGQFS